MRGLYYEEFEIGQVFEHALRRTVTEMDNTLFSALTHNPQPLHIDHEFARSTEWKQPLVNSLFTLGLMIGISVNDTTIGTTIGNLGMTDVKFPKPVFHGDTVRVTTEVVAMRESKSRPDAGLVTFHHRMFKQTGDLVAECQRQAFMRKHPQGNLAMRSMLFVPADSERKIAKALAIGADALILDLEDSVAAARKPAGREMARAFVAAEKARQPRPLLYVRINALDTDLWEDDLAAVMPAGPDGIMQPKTRSGEDVHRLSIALDHAEQRHGLTTGQTRIVPIVSEMPISILQMPSYVGASNRVTALNWGMEDLSAELGASSTRGDDGAITSPFRLARDLTLYTAMAAGVQPLDSVYPDFRDLTGLAAECKAAARDGFTGKAAIHPDQVAVINAAFTPSAAEIQRAQDLVGLFAESPGAGVISYNGQMLDRPHLIRAERLLARVKAIGLA